MNIVSSKYTISSPNLLLSPHHQSSEFAFIGRSNVGKSSLINSIANNKNLAKTSGTPGKTKLINFFLINNSFYFVDLPGYGYAKTSQKQRKNWVDTSSEYITGRKQLRHLFVLIDFRHKPQAIDLEFLSWVMSENVPFSVVATKSDKLNQKEKSVQIKVFAEFGKILNLPVEIIVSSAQTREGIPQILNLIQSKS